VIQTVTSVLGLAIASGVNLYAAVLVIGLGLRFDWIKGLPSEMDVLANPLVLVAAGAMYLVEFVADKIPFITPVWDAIHTLIRPLGAAALALGATADLSPAVQTLAGLAGGSVALGAHSSKMGVRLLAHATPEPATHSAISLLEDVGVVGLLILMYTHPWIAAGVVAALLIAMVLLARVLFRAFGSLWGRLRARIARA
jgi:hypothetical protein